MTIVADYKNAAVMAKEAGFDGVERMFPSASTSGVFSFNGSAFFLQCIPLTATSFTNSSTSTPTKELTSGEEASRIDADLGWRH